MRCGQANCEEEALHSSDRCWDHLNDKDPYIDRLISGMSQSRNLSGLNLKKIDLNGRRIEKIGFQGANLSMANFSGTHFFDCNFQRSDMIGTNLSDCDLSHCDLSGADLTKSSLIRARLWSADLTNSNLAEADLSSADMWDAKLYNVKIWRTTLTGTKSIFMRSFSKGKRILDNPKINESGALSAEDAYRDIKSYFISNGMYNDASWASFKEKSMERQVLRKKLSFSYLPSLIMNILCGYGEKPYRIILSAFLTILIFAGVYWSIDSVSSIAYPGARLSLIDYIYYSAITFTTVGYGDLVPKPFGLFRLLAAAEAFIGVYLTGLFVFTLARKYSAR